MAELSLLGFYLLLLPVSLFLLLPLPEHLVFFSLLFFNLLLLDELLNIFLLLFYLELSLPLFLFLLFVLS